MTREELLLVRCLPITFRCTPVSSHALAVQTGVIAVVLIDVLTKQALYLPYLAFPCEDLTWQTLL